jgi:hypothetical protein
VVVPSVFLRNALSRALRALGRIERILFTLQWLSDPRAGASGCFLFCSQSRNVPIGIWYRAANLACEMPNLSCTQRATAEAVYAARRICYRLICLMPAAAAGSVGANEGRISPVRSDDDARACGKRKREQQNEWPHFPSDPHA